MKIRLKKETLDFHLKATNEEGCSFSMDASPSIGGNNMGMRPMEVLLASLGGCSSIDVLLVLKKKKQTPSFYEVEVDAEREEVENYSLFRHICIHFKIDGEVSEESARKAIELSLQKYCSVAKALEPTATITYKLTLNGISKF